MYHIYVIILFSFIYPFGEACGPSDLFLYINNNCPENVCSESVFENWKKNSMNKYIDKFHVGISGEHYNIQNGKSYDEAVKNLIDTRYTKYSSNRSLKIDLVNMELDKAYSSDFKASSYGTLKKPIIVHKQSGDKYITYLYKCIIDYENDVEEHQRELLDEVNRYYSKYIDSKEMSDYSLAFEYLAYSYLYANSLIKNHPKISEMNKELTLFLGKISIDFDPSEINNVPAFVDNNRGATVSALYGSTPLDNFQLKAYFDRGMGEWKNNTEVFPTDSDGKSFLKIGKIISKSENQKILIIPDVKKIEDSRITEISYKKLDEKLRQSQSSGLSIKVRDKPSLAFKYKYKNKLGIENIIDNNLPNLLEEEFRPKFNSGDCSSSSDECIDVLVEISLKNQNKKSNMYNIGLDMFVDQKNIKEKYSSIVISINGDNNSSFFKDNNKKKIQESMNSLYNELFLATISYNLNPNVELVINKSKYTGKGQQKVDKGLVTFNFAYKNDKSNSNIFLHETELVVSSSIDLDDNFKAFTKFSPKDINYHFFITNSRDDNWNWNDVTIQWDGGDIQSWDEKQKIFEQCPDFSCRGNIIKSHELHIKKNGYLPGIFSVNVERLRAYKEIPNVKLEKLYDKARPIHHLLPGYSQRKYFQTNKMGRARGWGYHMVWAVSLAYIYKSFNEYTSANTEFNQISARYSGYGPDTPQQAFNDDWNLMEYNRNQYLGSRSNFSFGIALLATLYGLNSFEILTYQAR